MLLRMKTVYLASISLISLLIFANANATPNSFQCPNPSQITSFPVMPDPVALFMWFGPAEPTASTTGIGFGGKTPGNLISVEPATVNDKPGYMCIYSSTTHQYVSAEELTKYLNYPGNTKALEAGVGFLVYESK